MRAKNVVSTAGFVDNLKTRDRCRRENLARISESKAGPAAKRNDILPNLVITYLAVTDLKPPTRKVRKIEAAHVREVQVAIESFGFCEPLLVGDDGKIIDGMVRLEAAKQLGLEKVPCIRIDHLSEQEQRLIRLAVNRLAEKGQWDFDELRLEVEELVLNNAPIEISGFSQREVDQLLVGDDAAAYEDGPLEPPENAVPTTRLGDVFRLGPHRIICGDATDPALMRRLMEEVNLARLLFTDEPYNVKIAGNVTRGDHREFAMASGEMSDEQFLTFNRAWIEAALPWMHDGAILGSFIDWRGYPTIHAAATRANLTPLNLIVWAKTNAGMGSLYRSHHELLPLFKKGSASHVNNVELGRHGRWRSNLWTYAGASSLGSEARRGLKDHPTVKPCAMIEDALLDLTNRGDLVLDPFLGSGTTLMACEKTGRICRGLELDPLYVDVIIRRFESVTGIAATLEPMGERFADLTARRVMESGPSSSSAAPVATSG